MATELSLYFKSSQAILESCYPEYVELAKQLISQILQDKTLSRFDRFNKRLKISWGMEISFTDNLKITRQETRDCYALMQKISNLWFAFEYLVEVSQEVVLKDNIRNSKVDFYTQATSEVLGFNCITTDLNQNLNSQILCKNAWRSEFYSLLTYLKNHTKGGCKSNVAEIVELTKNHSLLHERHIFSLIYAIRNVYVHEGVAAALGGKKYFHYRLKRDLYYILHDALILYSIILGKNYCQRKLSQRVSL